MNLTKNGRCSRCGQCCTPFIPITEQERKTIADYIKEHNIQPANHKDGDNYWVLCTFYDIHKHQCNIYPVRPMVCREYLCSKSDKILHKNRLYYDERADYNGNQRHLDLSSGSYVPTLTPMDLLFFDDPTTMLNWVNKYLSPKTVEEFRQALIKFGQSELANCIIGGE